MLLVEIKTQIHIVERMPSHARISAMLSVESSPDLRTKTAPKVFLTSNRFKVRRVDARAITTEMIEIEARLNVTDPMFVGRAMPKA